MKIKGADVHVAGPLYAFGCGIVVPVFAWLSRLEGSATLSMGDVMTLLWGVDAVRFILAFYCILMASVYWVPAMDILHSLKVWETCGLPLSGSDGRWYRTKLHVYCAMMMGFSLMALIALPGPFFPGSDAVAFVKTGVALLFVATTVLPLGMTTRAMVASWAARKEERDWEIGV